ncbi:MAG: TetR/AcrR family transcriptional regulator [Actinobacteria bacterium]|nr:TetR/AcrR family transcriptional regulator [Actinomycetota bacterium]
MGPRHTRDEILEAAVATAFADGLHRLTYGRVARRLGTSDRMVVYYFPTKADLVGAVLVEIGLRLQASLAPAVTAPLPDHRALVRALWPHLARPEVDPVFARFFEAMGLAAAGSTPYADLVPLLVEAWIDWAATMIDAPEATRRSEATAAIATVDGLLLLRQIAGPAVADDAAHRLGVT